MDTTPNEKHILSNARLVEGMHESSSIGERRNGRGKEKLGEQLTKAF